MNKKRVNVGSEPTVQSKSDSAEPYFYVGLVLKGTEKQYVNLLKYVDGRNGSRIIYQCKSLTYLRVSREDRVGFRDAAVCGGELASEEATE
jgi:hypothetical protein